MHPQLLPVPPPHRDAPPHEMHHTCPTTVPVDILPRISSNQATFTGIFARRSDRALRKVAEETFERPFADFFRMTALLAALGLLASLLAAHAHGLVLKQASPLTVSRHTGVQFSR